VKILIVDDHPIVRAGLRRLLASEAGWEICEATDGKTALSAFCEQRSDVVVLDLNLPGVGGIEVISRLKAADPRAHVLILSMHDDPMHVTHALRAGAAGYVSKRASPDELLAAIRRVAVGQTYVEHEIAEELVFSNVRETPHPLTGLTSRDLEILRLLAEGKALPQIADTLGISYKTAANSSSHLKVKLGATNTADLIRIAIRSRLCDRDSELSA
jgi:two-component system, NarL family, invasion response regulator UvrY